MKSEGGAVVVVEAAFCPSPLNSKIWRKMPGATTEIGLTSTFGSSSLTLDGEGDADHAFPLAADEDAAKDRDRAKRRVQTIKGHISPPEIDRLRFEVDAAAHGSAERRPVYIRVVQLKLSIADRERRAELTEGDAALPDLLLALAAQRRLGLRIGQHVAHHGIAEHGKIARPERAGFHAGVARVEIDLKRGLAAIDLGIETDEAEGCAGVMRLRADDAGAVRPVELDSERRAAVELAGGIELQPAGHSAS